MPGTSNALEREVGECSQSLLPGIHIPIGSCKTVEHTPVKKADTAVISKVTM